MEAVTWFGTATAMWMTVALVATTQTVPVWLVLALVAGIFMLIWQRP